MTRSRHPVVLGAAVTAIAWLATIFAGVSAASVAVDTATNLGSLGVLAIASAALGVPGAVLAGFRTPTGSRAGRLARGYAASAGGGLVAIVVVFVVFQVGRGAVPALQAGDPGAALFSVVFVGGVLLFLAVVVLVASAGAAPFALLGSWLRSRSRMDSVG